MFSHDTTDHARQQDSEQQPGHHHANRFATAGFGCQRGSGRHDILCQRGRQSDHQTGEQQQSQRRRSASHKQGGAQHRRLDEDDLAAIETVAQRRQQQDAERIAQLRERWDEADGTRRRADVGTEHAEHRLAVIERGHRQTGAGCQQQYQRWRQCRQSRRSDGGVAGDRLRRLNRRHGVRPWTLQNKVRSVRGKRSPRFQDGKLNRIQSCSGRVRYTASRPTMAALAGMKMVQSSHGERTSSGPLTAINSPMAKVSKPINGRTK